MSLFDTGVRPAIDDWLLQKSREVRDYGNYWSASSAGYCHRRLIFERLGVPHVEKDDDARKQRVFTSGHLFHDWIQGITKAAGLSIAQEVELQDEELMIRGHFDDLVLVNDRLLLLDYKTRNSRNFDYAKRPSYFHKMQLGTYMYMLRKNGLDKLGKELDEFFQHTVEEARTLNIEKDTLRMAEVQYMWSDDLRQDIELYWRQLNGFWKNYELNGSLPPCTCANHEGGFLAKEAYNPYFYEGKPCSLEWLGLWETKDASK